MFLNERYANNIAIRKTQYQNDKWCMAAPVELKNTCSYDIVLVIMIQSRKSQLIFSCLRKDTEIVISDWNANKVIRFIDISKTY